MNHVFHPLVGGFSAPWGVLPATRQFPVMPGYGALVAASAGTQVATSGTVAFVNSNGISFGMSNSSQITASHDGLTTAAQSNHSHGNPTLALTNLTGTTASASNGFTLSLSAAAPGAGGGIAAAAGTQTGTSGTVAFVDSNGITFGMSGSTRITASHNGLTTAAASDHSHGNPTLALTNLTGTTASASNGFTLSLSAAAPGGGAAISAGINSQNTGTVAFVDSFGISFGLLGGSLTASHNGLTTAAASNHSHGNPTLALTNLTGTTASASNGFTLSLSAAAPGGGAANSISAWRVNELVTTAGIWNNATFSNKPVFVPFILPHAITAVGSVDMYLSRTGGTSLAATMFWGVYSIANATSMNLISSTSFNMSLTTSAQFSGIRRVQFTGLSALSLSPGHYVMGIQASMVSTASFGMNVMGIGSVNNVGIIHPGTNSTAATASGTHREPFAGVWNATSAGLPSAVAASSISGGAGGRELMAYAMIKAISA